MMYELSVACAVMLWIEQVSRRRAGHPEPEGHSLASGRNHTGIGDGPLLRPQPRTDFRQSCESLSVSSHVVAVWLKNNGGPLRAAAPREFLVWTIVYQVVCILARMHARGVAHGDVHPTNILVTILVVSQRFASGSKLSPRFQVDHCCCSAGKLGY